MPRAPTYDHWKALRLIAAALIAEALLNPARAFFRAVREAKAQAVALVFALARSLEDEDPVEKPERESRLGRLGGVRCLLDDETWRNPPAIPVRLEARANPKRGGPPSGPQTSARRPPSVTAALQTLRRILDLCDDPERHAARLKRRLDAVDAPLIASEAKAFAVQARAQSRRDREARRAIDRGWRGRRRAWRETG